MFQSTHLHEVWRWSKTTIVVICSFNPHTYMRCDTYSWCYHYVLHVSIHTPTWGVTESKVKTDLDRWFQSTHLHEVWLPFSFPCKLSYVSIHTPTWGVTDGLRAWCHLFQVSIHTPTWGVTAINGEAVRFKTFQSTHLHEVWRLYKGMYRNRLEFQSTHLHEVWHLCINAVIYAGLVSIHTPTWGVTLCRIN